MAPAEARLWQIAAPIPRVPPVTRATRPVSSWVRSAALSGLVCVVAMRGVPSVRLVEPLDDHGLAHPAGHAHRLEHEPAVDGVEVVEQGGHDARAGHPERVAVRSSATVEVELLGVDAELVAAGHDLRRDRLVHLDG